MNDPVFTADEVPGYGFAVHRRGVPHLDRAMLERLQANLDRDPNLAVIAAELRSAMALTYPTTMEIAA